MSAEFSLRLYQHPGHFPLSWDKSETFHCTSLRFFSILSSHLRLGLPSDLFPAGFSPHQILYEFPQPAIRAKCPANLILFDHLNNYAVHYFVVPPQLQQFPPSQSNISSQKSALVTNCIWSCLPHTQHAANCMCPASVGPRGMLICPWRIQTHCQGLSVVLKQRQPHRTFVEVTLCASASSCVKPSGRIKS